MSKKGSKTEQPTPIVEVVNGGQGLVVPDAETKAKQVFDLLDVTEATRTDYKYRIGLFLGYVQDKGFTRNSFLEFKRALAGRTDLAVSTKNKYLATAKIFLKEANRQGVLPADITQNVKTFSQSKKHKRDGLNDAEIKKLTDAMRALRWYPMSRHIFPN